VADWSVCPTCGLRHSRGAGRCPRCGPSAQPPGAPGAFPGPPRVPSPGAQAARRTGGVRKAAVPLAAILGMILLMAVARQVGKSAGRGLVERIHLRDPALVKQERDAEWQLEQLRKIAATEAAERARCGDAAADRSERWAVFEGADAALEPAAAAAGLEVRARLAPRDNRAWVTTAIELRVEGGVTGLLEALERLEPPAGTWVEAARCSVDACSLVFAAARKAARTPGPAVVWHGPPLPPRPWWPPSAQVWDRVTQLREEIVPLRALADEIGTLRNVRREVEVLDDLLGLMRSSQVRGELARCVEAVREAGGAELEARRDRSGILVTLPVRTPEVERRLGKVGIVEPVGQMGAGYAIELHPRPGRLDATPFRYDYPAGFALGT